jgi:succinate dehydrogenase/fumarate reductase cytochrome b subunit (b558 family)
MRRVLTLYSTTVGKKVVMAVTGILLVGFVLGHMAGNLKLYLAPHDGDYALDHYGHGLRVFGDPFLAEGQFLWLFRLVLLAAVALHVWSAISLKLAANAARPQRYAKTAYQESTLASRTMIWGGILLVVFIVFHILHFTTGHVTPGMDFVHGEVHANVTNGLSVPWVAASWSTRPTSASTRHRRRHRPGRRSAAATLAELGYNVKCFCFQDSPRRAHSIAAQGGINAAKNYQNDGDSVYRLFYDTVKGGDFRAREANVYRLAEVSVNIIDQCVAQGVPFAREYGGLLANRSFGGAQVSRTFYARGQTGQQLLLGAYQALMRQVAPAR